MDDIFDRDVTLKDGTVVPKENMQKLFKMKKNSAMLFLITSAVIALLQIICFFVFVKNIEGMALFMHILVILAAVGGSVLAYFDYKKIDEGSLGKFSYILMAANVSLSAGTAAIDSGYYLLIFCFIELIPFACRYMAAAMNKSINQIKKYIKTV